VPPVLEPDEPVLLVDVELVELELPAVLPCEPLVDAPWLPEVPLPLVPLTFACTQPTRSGKISQESRCDMRTSA